MNRIARSFLALTALGLGGCFVLALFFLVFIGFENPEPCLLSGPNRDRMLVVGDTTTAQAGSFSYSVCHPVENTRYVWRSSNTEVFTVDQEGVIRATGVGEAQLFVSEENKQQNENGYRRGVPVRVIPPVDSVALRPARLRVAIGDTVGGYRLTAYDSSGQAIEGVPTFALVGKDSVLRNAPGRGRFTAIKPGTTTVTARGIINRKARATVVVRGSSARGGGASARRSVRDNGTPRR